MFDQISSTYDRVNRILSLGMDRGWRRALVRRLPAQSPLRVLDLATGTGDQLFSLFESGVSIASAWGVDLSRSMLDIAKRKIKGSSYESKVQWLCADAEALPFSDEVFDVAAISFGIRNVKEPMRCLQEMRRTLAPKGKALILEFSLPPQPFRSFYLFYLRHLLPRVGGFVSKAPFAYRYLNETIETFPFGEAFCSLLRSAGFIRVERDLFAMGAVTLYSGEKP